MRTDPSSPLCGIAGRVDLEPRRARDNDPIYYTTCEKNTGRDYQSHVEAAYCDCLSSDKGSKRNSKKERAVVPSKHCTSSSRKVVGKTGLLRGKE
jgi:hypothetical protein